MNRDSARGRRTQSDLFEALMSKGAWEDALKFVESELGLPGNRSSIELWRMRMLSLLCLGRFEEAKGCFKPKGGLPRAKEGEWWSSMAGNVDSAPLQYSVLLDDVIKRCRETAALCYDMAVKLRPQDAAISGSQANLLSRMGRKEDETKAHERVVAAGIEDANDFYEWYRWAESLCALGRWKEAAAAYDRSAELNNGDAGEYDILTSARKRSLECRAKL